MDGKLMYLVKYTDNSDNTSGVVCGSSTRKLSEGAQIAVGKWLDLPVPIEKKERERVINGLIENEFVVYGDYELFVEETFIY